MSAAPRHEALNAFVEELKATASDCNGFEWTLLRGEYDFPDEKKKLARQGLAQACLRAQQLLIRASSVFPDFKSMDTWVRNQPLLASDLDEFVIPFALGFESEHLTQVSYWLGDYLKECHNAEDNPGRAAARTGRFYRSAPYSNDEPNARDAFLRPAFFKDGEFRHGFMYLAAFRPEAITWAKEVVDDSRHNVPESARWVNLIHKAGIAHQDTQSVIDWSLRDLLSKVKPQGLETLREYVLGSHIPNGQECSERTEKLLRTLVGGELESIEIENQMDSLRLNELYFRNVLPDEITHVLSARCKYFNDNERGDEYDGGVQSLKQLTEFFRQCALSPEDLSRIAQSVTANFTLGRQMDVRAMPVADQFDQVLLDTQEKSTHNITFNPPENLRHAVLSAVCRVLPKEMAVDISSRRDASRVMFYTMTNQQSFLRGIVDKRLADSVFSADLGL